MRLRLTVGLFLLITACAPPHSNGAVWAQQNLDAERIMFQLGDAQRAQRAAQYALSVVDVELNRERERLSDALQACPGLAEPLRLSASDRLRDGLRIEVQGEPARLAQISNLALADWYVRRAAASRDVSFCSRASDALRGIVAAPTSGGDLLAGSPIGTVMRDVAESPAIAPSTSPPLVALSNYALGYLDAVSAPAPLPQYLAGVYGGVLEDASPIEDPETAEGMVDAQAPAYPQWEPDALYLALRGGSMP
jgi:hypothetical protein